MRAKKVILETYYNLDGEYILFNDNPLHNQSYKNVNVEFKQSVHTMCGIDFDVDIIEIEGQEPIECELIGYYKEAGDVLLVQLCQDWG